MNLLILSSHSILEYDDLRLFSRLGYDVFMPGGYSDPVNPGETMRPPIPDAPYHPELVALCQEQYERHAGVVPGPGIVDWAKADLHPGLIDWADAIMVNCFPVEWIGGQWERIRDKRVIWRTIGQSNPWVEHEMRRFEGLQIVRYSPAEARAFGADVFAGEDAMIRFGKDPADYGPWTGTERVVGNLTQNMDQRAEWTGYDFWREATQGLPTLPAGLGSERIGGTGRLTYAELRDYLCRIRVMLYTGTQPASYTLGFMEAMLTGTPTISIPADGMWLPPLFEAAELAPWRAHDAPGAQRFLRAYLDKPLAEAYIESQAIRQRGIDLFSYDVVGPQWIDFLGAPVALAEAVA